MLAFSSALQHSLVELLACCRLSVWFGPLCQRSAESSRDNSVSAGSHSEFKEKHLVVSESWHLSSVSSLKLNMSSACLLQELLMWRRPVGVFGVWNRRLRLLGPLPDSRPLSAVSIQQLLLQSLRCPHDPVRPLQLYSQYCSNTHCTAMILSVLQWYSQFILISCCWFQPPRAATQRQSSSSAQTPPSMVRPTSDHSLIWSGLSKPYWFRPNFF